MAWVVFGENGLACEIAKNHKQAIALAGDRLILEIPRYRAVREIRQQIFLNQSGQCLRCPTRFTINQMHMHEKQHRGRGGNISLKNSIGLCADCHLKQEHGDRNPKWKVNENEASSDA